MTLSRAILLAAGAPAALLVCTGCPNNPPDSTQNPPLSGGALVPFQSRAEMLGFVKEQANARVSSPRLAAVFDVLFAGGAAAPASITEDSAGGDGSSGGFTATNLQEEGVDESDVVKTDGVSVFVASGNTLHVVRAADNSLVSSLDLPHSVDSLFLVGSQLFALQRGYDAYSGGPEILIWPPYYTGTTSHVAEIDVSDPAAPQVVSSVDLDGALAGARIVNDHLLLILTVAPTLPAPFTAVAAARLELEDVLPTISVNGDTQTIADWDAWLRPESPNGYYLTTVLTLPLADIGRVVGRVGVVGDAGTVYVSPQNVYLADTDYSLSGTPREETAIHRLAVGEDGSLRYAGSGAVPGRPLNQFSLGEHRGDLRIATHVMPTSFGPFPVDLPAGDDAVASSDGSSGGAGSSAVAAEQAPPQPSNAVFVLRPDEEELKVVGRLTGLAPGERIYSARFLGDRGFLVTFRQIDPLFALDLSDPTNPKNVGELKIPGFSDYLHPIGDTHLIGIGRSTIATQWGGVVPGGVQLSLFDVRDLSKPTLVEQIELGGPGSTCDVSYSHKAFAFLAESGTLALPVTLYGEVAATVFPAPPPFEGVACFRVNTESGFESIGELALPGDSALYRAWRRALMIDGEVFAITTDGVSSAPLGDLSNKTDLRLP